MNQKLSQEQIKMGIKKTPFTCPNCSLGVFQKPDTVCGRCRCNEITGKGLDYYKVQDSPRPLFEVEN